MTVDPAVEGADPDRPRGSRGPQILAKRKARLEALATAEHVVPVNFAVVGVQKAGTSTLYRMLVQHPEVAGGPEKEMRLFMDESRDWDHPDYAEFARPAAGAGVRLAGDATPAYLFWPGALDRMRDYDPGLRLIATFRDPVERALSHWSMERSWNRRFLDLATAFERFGDAGLPERADVERPAQLRRTSMFSRGLYGAQLRRGLDLFPRAQWLLLDFRTLVADPATTLDAATDFLGIERFTDHPELLHQNRTPSDHEGAAPSVEAFARLVERYAADLAVFGELSGLDVSHWPTSQVAAGTMPVEEFHDRMLAKVGLRPGGRAG